MAGWLNKVSSLEAGNDLKSLKADIQTQAFVNGTTDLYSSKPYFSLPLDLALKIHSSGLFSKQRENLQTHAKLSEILIESF